MDEGEGNGVGRRKSTRLIDDMVGGWTLPREVAREKYPVLYFNVKKSNARYYVYSCTLKS